MFLVYEDAMMPLIPEQKFQAMIRELKEDVMKRAKSDYVGLVVNIFQGLYTYQQVGINISPYREVEEAATGEKMGYTELMTKSHELARQLVRRRVWFARRPNQTRRLTTCLVLSTHQIRNG
jgi:hypothetical protein